MFRVIEGFENYVINEEGIVINNKYNRQLAQTVSKEGYAEVQLWKDGKGFTKLVHRLVGLTFIPNPDNLPQVLHLDDNRRNPHVDNLAWGTNKQNCKQKTSKEGNGRISKKKAMRLYKSKQWKTAEDYIIELMQL